LRSDSRINPFFPRPAVCRRRFSGAFPISGGPLRPFGRGVHGALSPLRGGQQHRGLQHVSGDYREASNTHARYNIQMLGKNGRTQKGRRYSESVGSANKIEAASSSIPSMSESRTTAQTTVHLTDSLTWTEPSVWRRSQAIPQGMGPGRGNGARAGQWAPASSFSKASRPTRLHGKHRSNERFAELRQGGWLRHG
jgi:hypothetical protein